MKKIFTLLFIVFISIGAHAAVLQPDANGIVYVKKGATGVGNSWSNAVGELADALWGARNLNESTPGKVKQIWVAAGTYFPKYDFTGVSNSRRNTFLLLDKVQIYGGFAGTELAIEERYGGPSILSGDIGAPSFLEDNCYNVVTGLQLSSDTKLNGFSITGGYADLNAYSNVIKINNVNCSVAYFSGGGLFLGFDASPVLENVTVNYNYGILGGGFCIADSHPLLVNSKLVANSSEQGGGMVIMNNTGAVFENVVFERNNSNSSGGAVYAVAGATNNILYFKNCTFTKNKAEGFGGAAELAQNTYAEFSKSTFDGNAASGGGAIHAETDVTLAITASQFLNNIALGEGGGACLIKQGKTFQVSKTVFAGNLAIKEGGAVCLQDLGATAILTDVLITGNKAGHAGGLLPKNTSINLVNCTISGNYANDATGGVYFYESTKELRVVNTVISGNSRDLITPPSPSNVIVNYSLIGGVAPDPPRHNLGALDPMFVSPISFTDAPTTAGNFTLKKGSPCINAGSIVYYSSDPSTAVDLAGNNRVYQYGQGGILDIGAYEFSAATHTIDASDLQAVYGDQTVSISPTTSTGLPLEVRSLDYTTVEAFPDGQGNTTWKLKLLKAGEALISIKEINSDNTTGDSITVKITVAPASLTATARDSTKTYDGIAFTGGNGLVYSGFVNGDDEQVLTGTLNYIGSANGAQTAGQYELVPSGLQAANYTINFVKGTLTIKKAPLQVTANDASKTYDGQPYAGGAGVTYSGFVNGEGAYVFGGSLSYSGNAQGAVNAGVYAITPKGLLSKNYTLNYTDGKLTIEQAPLTITAKDSTKTYNGQAFSNGNGVIYSGFVNGENEQVLTGALTWAGSAQAAVAAGEYELVPSGLQAANYYINFVKGTLTVQKAALQVTANNAVKNYDAQAFSGGNGVTYSGFVNGEDAQVVTGTVSYTGNAQGAVGAGTYNITPLGLTAANYTLNYVDGLLTIGKAPLTVIAKDVTKVYDGTAFSQGNGVTYSGFQGADDAQVVTGTLSYGGNAQGAKNAGSYTLTASGLTAANYNLTYTSGTLLIQPAVLQVIATDAARCYGAANPAFGVRYQGFVGAETETALITKPVASAAATSSTAAGQYAINVSGGTAANYTLSYTNGLLTIYALPVSQLTAPQGTLLCGTASIPVMASGNYSFAWYKDQNLLSGITTASIPVNSTGTYTAVATDAHNCTAPVSNSIVVTTQLPLTPDFSFSQYCAGIRIPFTNNTSTGTTAAVYNWATSDGQTGQDVNPRFAFAAAGAHWVKLTVAPQACPSLTREITKDINIEAAVPGVNLPAVNTPAGVPVQLRAREFASAAYNWTPATGLSDTRIANPSATLTSSQAYQVTMNFPSGCSTTDQLQVNVLQQAAILVANVFSPNGDGRNDLLLANLSGVKQLRYFRVFNRGGKKIFETSDAGQGWDGRFNGALQPMTSYVWIAEGIDFNGNTVRNQGTVTLLR